MNKTELKQAIKNGENVWFADKCNEKVWEIDLNKKYKPEIYLDQILYVYQNINDRFKQEFFIEDIFKTKAEAEHYLHHANITRTETLPFLTWEEFLNQTEIYFYGADGVKYYFYYDEPFNRLVLESTAGSLINEDLTEANFYKAYDECVRLFKGGE